MSLLHIYPNSIIPKHPARRSRLTFSHHRHCVPFIHRAAYKRLSRSMHKERPRPRRIPARSVYLHPYAGGAMQDVGYELSENPPCTQSREQGTSERRSTPPARLVSTTSAEGYEHVRHVTFHSHAHLAFWAAVFLPHFLLTLHHPPEGFFENGAASRTSGAGDSLSLSPGELLKLPGLAQNLLLESPIQTPPALQLLENLPPAPRHRRKALGGKLA
jgi:hypothetical protein